MGYSPNRKKFLSPLFLLLLVTVNPLAIRSEEPSVSATSSGNKKEKVVLEPDPSASPQYWAERKLQMRFGLQFYSNDNVCRELFATLPFPRNWPEQKVTVLGADLPNQARYKEREIAGGVKQLVIEVPALPANQQLDVVVHVAIEKSFIKLPDDPTSLAYPKKTLKTKEILWSLGNSPYIDTDSRQVRTIVKEIKDRSPENAWQHVEAIYDWVRENIQYRNGPIRSTQDALKDKYGDCEEMTGLFVAICRASNIPARCVWIPEHCYPEFYLEDSKGFGYWFPCQVAGDRQFGQMQEYRPILQKGDRFKIPEEKGFQRYVPEFFKCTQRAIGPIGPDVKTIRDLGELQAELDKMKAASQPAAAEPSAKE